MVSNRLPIARSFFFFFFLLGSAVFFFHFLSGLSPFSIHCACPSLPLAAMRSFHIITYISAACVERVYRSICLRFDQFFFRSFPLRRRERFNSAFACCLC